MRILITGATGFVGCHLVRELAAQGVRELYGLAHLSHWLLEGEDFGRHVRLYHQDLCATEEVRDVLAEARPDRVIHLAGYADVGGSFKEPEAAWRGNLEATRSLYDAIAAWGGKPRILFVGTGAVYGEAKAPGQRFTEDTPFRPTNPYATSKAAADLLSYQYVRTHGLDVVRARPFNHVGPGQAARFALANFAWQIANVEAGRQPPLLQTGNLWTERDFTDVRDVVRAYWTLLERGEPGEAYNVATGQTRPMRHFLDQLLSLSTSRIEVVASAELTRQVETATVQVDVSRLTSLGWSPRYGIEQTLRDTLNYCRGVVAQMPA